MTRTATEIEGRIASAGGIIIPIAATSPRSSPMCEDDESRTPQEQRAGTRRARKYCSRSSTVLQPPPSSRTTRNGSCTGRAALVQLLLVLAQLLVAFAPVASSSSYPRGSPSWASLRSPWRSPHRWGSFAGQLVGRRQEPVSAAVVSTMVPRGGLLIQDDDESDDDEEEGEEYDEYETGDEGDEYDEEEEEEDAVVATAGSEKKAAKAKKQKGSAVLADAEYDEPLVASPLTNMYASIAVILLGRKVDLMSPTVVRIARFAFIAYLVALQIFLLYVRRQAKAADDRTPITVTNPLSSALQAQLGGAAAGGGDGNDGAGSSMVKNLASSFLSTESTVLEYDLKQAKSMQSGLVINMGFMWFLHFKLGQVQPLLIQSMTGISNMVYSPLFQAYVLGRNLERPFKNPAARRMEEAAAAAAAAAGTAGAEGESEATDEVPGQITAVQDEKDGGEEDSAADVSDEDDEEEKEEEEEAESEHDSDEEEEDEEDDDEPSDDEA